MVRDFSSDFVPAPFWPAISEASAYGTYASAEAPGKIKDVRAVWTVVGGKEVWRDF